MRNVKEKRRISDAEYEEALANPDNRGLMESFCHRYRKIAPFDDLWQYAQKALWKSLQGHQPDHPSGQKFTSSLYQFLEWEFDREAKKISRKRLREKSYIECSIEDLSEDTLVSGRTHRRNVSYTEEVAAQYELVRENMRLLPSDVRKLLHQRYFENRSIEDIGGINGFSKETARNRLNWGINRLRELCTEE